jgi:phthiodiolone/phenolphthiodiolone dimycocerosates ketoreductase
MTPTAVTVEHYISPNPPLGLIRASPAFAQLIRLDSVVVEDHFQDFYPTTIWDE